MADYPLSIPPWLSKTLGNTDWKVTALAGDGSTRCFFRVSTATGTQILLQDPAWKWTADYKAHRDFLSSRGLPVPEFYKVDPAAGFLLMEDLGDELLQNRIAKEPAKKMAWLERACALLAELHGKTYPVPTDLPVASRSFDTQKYSEEMAFTLEHLYNGYLGLSKKTGTALFTPFCEVLSRLQPLVFAHRDYHCRNLLVSNDKLWMIDFQDARMGSPHYDLASLVYDAYVDLSDAERKHLVDHYKATLQPFPLFAKISWAEFESDLKLVAFQRTFKAAGSFASFFTRYGKKTHLGYLVPALKSTLQLQESPKIPADLKTELNIAHLLKLVTDKGN